MTRTELQAIAGRYLDSSRDALGDTGKPIRKALPMPYPLNDDELEANPAQWHEYFGQLAEMAKDCQQRRPIQKRVRRR